MIVVKQGFLKSERDAILLRQKRNIANTEQISTKDEQGYKQSFKEGPGIFKRESKTIRTFLVLLSFRKE